MRSQKVNEKGMTLVEILAALVILGIVFVGFMTIFPQMINFNEKTEDKLVTMNLAKKELAAIKKSKMYLTPEVGFEGKGDFDRFIYPGSNGKYTIEVDYYTRSEEGLDDKDEDAVSLHKVHVKVKIDDKISSETFGYIAE